MRDESLFQAEADEPEPWWVPILEPYIGKPVPVPPERVERLKRLFGGGTPPVAQKGVAAAMRAAMAKVNFQTKVPWIQTVLNRAEGENLVVDGLYGPRTLEAIRRFQSRHGLRVEGILPPQTETALIQTGLNAIAQSSILPVNGVMDSGTRQEIARFQRRSNLAADAIVGPRTRTAMIAALR